MNAYLLDISTPQPTHAETDTNSINSKRDRETA